MVSSMQRAVPSVLACNQCSRCRSEARLVWELGSQHKSSGVHSICKWSVRQVGTSTRVHWVTPPVR